ncbi:MAG: hypothetical protein IKK75_06120 [Clostridia bacterium]|nr:hypothetical protein [Clostridia bacterium]
MARFDEKSKEKLHTMMRPFGANKIPFGRGCDREAANAEMDYHLTLMHWSKEWDAQYLPLVENLKPSACRINVTGKQMMCAEEGSLLLYLTVEPSNGYPEMIEKLEKSMAMLSNGFLHITLAVSQHAQDIISIDQQLQETVDFPFELTIEGFDLYHIWKPTRKMRSW